MTQTVFVPQDDHFEGIGPYAQQQFRLTTGPNMPSRPLPAPESPTQEPPRSPVILPEIEALEQRISVSAHWCDVGISLLVLGSGAAALFRLICLGEP